MKLIRWLAYALSCSTCLLIIGSSFPYPDLGMMVTNLLLFAPAFWASVALRKPAPNLTMFVVSFFALRDSVYPGWTHQHLTATQTANGYYAIVLYCLAGMIVSGGWLMVMMFRYLFRYLDQSSRHFR